MRARKLKTSAVENNPQFPIDYNAGVGKGNGWKRRNITKKPNPNFLPYEELKDVVRGELIASRQEYCNWWDFFKPKFAPKKPEYVYEEWAGWGEFLGNENTFCFDNIRHRYIGFNNARKYALSLNFKTIEEWFHYEHHPPTIPIRPDLYYKGKFGGWSHFLGFKNSKPVDPKPQFAKARTFFLPEVRKMAKQERKILLFAASDSDSNTVHVSIQKSKNVALQYIRDNELFPLRGFYMQEGYDYESILKMYGSDQGDGYWLINNINECLFNIDLDMVK